MKILDKIDSPKRKWRIKTKKQRYFLDQLDEYLTLVGSKIAGSY